MTLSKVHGEDLRASLLAGERLTLAAKGILQSPYLYDDLRGARRINATHVNT